MTIPSLDVMMIMAFLTSNLQIFQKHKAAGFQMPTAYGFSMIYFIMLLSILSFFFNALAF